MKRVSTLPENISFVKFIEAALFKRYEQIAKDSARTKRENILLIPDDVEIDANLLGNLTSIEFIKAYKDMQELIICIYHDIENCPFEWGYPDYDQTDGYYHRVTDLLLAFTYNGVFLNDSIVVKTKSFLSDKRVKAHKKIESMLIGFSKMGLVIKGFDKKNNEFTVTAPSNPHVIYVLWTYISLIPQDKPNWLLGMPRLSFSYRFVENPRNQKYETVFLAELDCQSDKLKEIQYWLHDEAKKLGFKIDVNEWREKDCILYKNGSKRFILVGERVINGVPIIVSKVIFRNVLVTKKDKMEEMSSRFPTTFKSNCTLCGGTKLADGDCVMRIKYELGGKNHSNCAYNSFVFRDLALNDVKDLLELFIIENKLKPQA